MFYNTNIALRCIVSDQRDLIHAKVIMIFQFIFWYCIHSNPEVHFRLINAYTFFLRHETRRDAVLQKMIGSFMDDSIPTNAKKEF